LINKLLKFKKLIRYSKYFNYFDPFTSAPQKKFLIYTRGRTGSTVLTDLLNCHPDVFCDYEIFNLSNTKTKVRYPRLYIDSCAKRAVLKGKQVYGFKVKIEQFRDEHNYPDDIDLFNRLNDDGWKFIYLKRENSLNHKISGIISNKTNVFHVKRDKDFSHGRINIDCQLLLDILNWGDELDRMEEDKIDGIPHLKLVYENDLLDNSKHQSTADKAFSFLGVDSHQVNTRLKKIIPANLRDIILNYDEMVEFLKGTKFACYLEKEMSIG